MDVNYRRALRLLGAFVIFASILISTPVRPAESATRTFGTPRFAATESGDIVMAANTLLTCSASTSCANAQAGVGTPRANNDYTMIAVDTDDLLGLDPLNITGISSAATLNLPAGSNVLFAGLYWGAAYSSGTEANLANVKFATPASGGYVDLVATQVDTTNNTYQSFRDVTTLVRTAGAGQYVVGGVQARTGSSDRHAGWSLVVAYANPSQPYRNLTVFDGYQRVRNGEPTTITVNGFVSPPVGPVTARIGFVAYEGDNAYTGDFARLNATQISDAINPATNFFNSRISDGGVLKTAKNPNYVDQLGFDATITNTVGILPAGSTSASITMDSNGDQYYPGVVTAAIDVFVPNLVQDLKKTVTDDNGGNVHPGDILTYNISFSNQGQDAGVNVILQDPIPANTTYLPGSLRVVSGANAGPKTDAGGDDTARFDGAGNQVIFNLGTGATATAGGRVPTFASSGVVYNAQFKVRVSSGTEGLNAVNTGVLYYVGETIPTAFKRATPTTTSPIFALADVKLISKIDSADPVLAGTSVAWTVTAASDGPSPAQNVVITDSLEPGLVFDPAGSDPRCTASGSVVSCLLGTMGVATTDSVVIAVDVPASMAGGNFTNSAQISTTTTDLSSADDVATEQTTINRLIDLEVAKAAAPNPVSGPSSAVSGGQIDYVVTVTNHGPASATNVNMSDLLPSGLTPGAPTVSGGGSCLLSAGNLNCSWPNLAVGASVTVSLTADIDPGMAAGTNLTNAATVSADEAEVSGGFPNSTSVDTPLVRQADLSVSKTAAGPAVAGSSLAWNLSVSNAGPSHARNVTVSDALPPGVTFDAALSSSGCNEAAGVVTCVTTQVDAGSSGSFTIGVRLDEGLGDGALLSNTATATSDASDPDTSNNSATETVSVGRITDLSIVKSGPGTIRAGGQITYRLDVANAGPSEASNVVITDTLPPGVTLSSAPGCSGGPVLTCSIASIGASSTFTFTVVVDVPGTIADGTNLINAATVTGDESDSNPSDNSSQLTTTTDRTTQLEITKAESSGIPDPILAGTAISWDIEITNLTSSADTNVALTDVLTDLGVIDPVTATITGATGTCSVAGLAVNCSIPLLAGNSTATVVVTAVVDPTLTSGHIISNVAWANGDFSSPVSGVEETTVRAEADLELTKSGPAALIAGQNGTWTLTATNNGNAQAGNVTVADNFPLGVTFQSYSASPASVTCTPTGASLNCAVGDLAPGATVSVDVVALVDRTGAAGTITNNSNVGSTTTDPNLTNNSASVSTSITKSAALSLVKTATSPSAPAGGIVTFSLTATNAGPSLATGVVLTDTVPAGLSLNLALSDASCSQSGNTVTCNPGDLDPLAAPVSVNLAFDIDSAQTPGAYANSAIISALEPDADTSDNTDSAGFNIVSLADLGLVKSSPPAPAVPGLPYTYTIDVSNAGPSLALAPTVIDTLAPGTSLAAGSSPGCSEAPAGTVTCTLSDLAPGSIQSVTIVIDIDPDMTGSLSNSASVNSATTDPNPSNNTGTDVTPLVPAADLVVSKTAPSVLDAGRNLAWTISVSNLGPSTSTNTTVTDTLPASVTFNAAASPACSAIGQSVTCDIGTIAPGSTITISIVGTVDPSATAGSVISNSAAVGGDVADPDTTNNADSVSTEIGRSADLSLTKVALPGIPVAGGNVSYEITLTNNGPSTASAVFTTDTFVSALTPVSATPSGLGTCAIAGQVVTCSGSELLPGQSLQATIVGQIDSTANVGDTITNVATGSGSESDPDSGNNTASETITVTRVADVGIAKVAAASTGVAGGPVVWNLTATNYGPSLATAIEVSDPLGSNMTFDPTGSSPSCSESAGVVTCTAPALASGSSTTFAVATLLNPSVANGATVTNSATIDSAEGDPNPDNDTSGDSVLVSTSADLRLDKSSPSTPPVPGTTTSWGLEVINDGPSDATAVVVTDTLPTGTTFNAAASSPLCNQTVPGTVECTIATVAAGATTSFTVAADIASGRVGTVSNLGVVSAATSDPDTDNNDDFTSDGLVPTADLETTKTLLSSPAVAGQSVDWLVSVSNNGPSDATAVVVSDDLDTNLTFIAATSDPRCSLAGSIVSCAIGTLISGSSDSVVISTAMSSSLVNGAAIVNTATAGSTTNDIDLTNNTDSANGTVLRLADLSISKTAASPTTIAGDISIWNFEVQNLGPSSASGLVVSDALPPGSTFNSAASDPGCSESGGVVSCIIADLANGASATGTIAMTLPAGLAEGATVSNTVSVGANETDPVPANDTSTATVGIARQADLVVTKNAPVSIPVPGQVTSWVIDVANDGPSDALGIVVSDTLPPGVSYDAAGSDPGCSESGGVVSCPIAGIGAGATASVTIAAFVSPGQLVDLGNTAAATATETDPNTSNNTDSVDVGVAPQADLATTKSLTTSPVVAGELVLWTVQVTNAGPSDARNVSVADFADSSMTFNAANSSGGCSTTGSMVTCPVGTLAAGSSQSLIIAFDLAPDAVAGATLTNNATVNSTTPDPDSTNNTSTAGGSVTRAADLALAKTASTLTATAGESAAFTLSITNNGPSDAINVTVTDLVPAGATFDSAASHPACTLSGVTITCLAPALTNSATTSFIVAFDIAEGFGDSSNLINTASVAGDETDPDLSNNTASASIAVTRSADLALAKSAPTPAPVPGSATSWDLTSFNAGPSLASGIVVSDTLPPGTTFDAATSDPGCSETSPGIVECVVIDLASGAGIDTTIGVNISATSLGTLTNSATVAGDEIDSDPLNNTATSSAALNPSADLLTTKTLDTTPVLAGESVSWTVSVTNNGPSDARNVAISDITSPTASFDPATSSPTCDDTGSITCVVGTLGVGTTQSFTLNFDLDSQAVAGSTLTNTALATSDTTDPDPSNNEASASGPVTTSADLAVSKTALAPSMIAGETSYWELTITNLGPSAAANVILTDPLPAGATLNTAASDPGCVLVGSNVECPVGTLLVGSITSLTIALDLDSALPHGSVVANTATVASDTPELDSSNNSATATAGVVRSADLGLNKIHNGAPAIPGTITSWHLTVVNDGPSEASGITISDTLGTGLTFDSATSSPACNEPSPGTVSCTIVNLAPGGSSTVTIGTLIDPSVTGIVNNGAVVTANESDPNPANDGDVAGVLVEPQSDVAITKDVVTVAGVAGEPLEWLLTVSNAGPSDATDVIVSDTFPASLVLDAAASDLRCVDLGGGLAQCDLATLAAGASESLSVIFDVSDSVIDGATLTNSAAVASSSSDPDLSNNSSSASSTIGRSSDIAITKTGPATAVAGDTITYDLTMTNDGPSVANNAVLTDAAPGELTLNTVTGDPSCAIVGNTLTCAPGSLDPAETITATVTATINSATAEGTSISNNASGTSDSLDANGANNNASVTTDVTREVNLGLTKTLLNSGILAGQPVQWELTLTNSGPSNASGIVITDTLPPGLVFRPDLSSAGCVAGVLCPIGVLPAGQSITVVVGSDSDPGLVLGNILTNVASVAGNETELDPASTSASATGTVTRAVDLGIVKQGPATAVIAGTGLAWTLDVSNAGPSDATGVVVTDTLPAGISFDGGSSDGRCSAVGQIVTCPIGNLGSGSSDSLAIGVAVASGVADGSMLTNTVRVAAAQGDPDTTNNSSSHSVDIARASGLVVTKSDLTDPVVSGQQVGWIITVGNPVGPSDTDNVVVTDTLPAGVSYDAGISDPACSELSGVVTCNLASLAVGTTSSFTIFADTDPSLATGQILTNTVSVSGDGAGSASTTEETTMLRVADLSVDKSANLTEITPGLPVIYEILVTNNGPSVASNIEVLDALPPGSVITAVDPIANCVTTPGSLTCTFPSLDPGASRLITLDVTPESWLLDGSNFDNTAVVTAAEDDPDPADNTSNARVGVDRLVNVTLSKTAPSPFAAAGDTVAFELSAANTGPSDATAVTITDTLPPGVTYNAGGSSPACSESSGTVICPIATIAAGDIATVTIAVDIDPATTGDVVNVAVVTTTEPNSNPDPTATETITVSDLADLTISKSAPAVVKAGENLEFTLEVTNNGPGVARNVTLNDTLPGDLSAVSLPTDCSLVGADLLCDLGDLAPGETGSVVLDTIVQPGTTQPIANTATTTSDAGEVNPADNVASSATVVIREANLTVSKSALTLDAPAGGQIAWLIEVFNQGPSSATAVVLSDMLPSELTLDSPGSSPGCDNTTGTTLCALPNLQPGETTAITILTDVAPLASGVVTNVASATASEIDPDPATAIANATVTVRRADAALGIAKSGSRSPLKAGDVVTWTITITNGGAEPILNPITVTDPIPAGHDFHSVVPGSPTCGLNSGVLSCELASLAAGQSLEIRLKTRVVADFDRVSNTATASASGITSGTGPDGVVVVSATAEITATSGLAYTGSALRLLLTVAAILMLIGLFFLKVGRLRSRSEKRDAEELDELEV